VDTLLSVSSDGKKLAFHRRTGREEQTLLEDLETGRVTIIPIPGDARPIISNDGQRIAYSVSRDGKHLIYEFTAAFETSQQLCDDCGTLMAESPDSKRLVYSLENGSIGMLDMTAKRKSVLIQSDGTILEQGQFSPDGKWIAFISTVDEEHSQIRVASLEGDAPPHPDRWIQITDGKTRDLRPAWSRDGNSLFFLSNRDGFYCVWQLNLDPLTKHAQGDFKPVQHFHYARLSAMHLSMDAMGLSQGGGNLFLNLAEITGNIFAGDLR
jgi:Tol biopolymer transport system component